jgi:dTDP-4-dehydrorhamnose reductase
MNLAENPETLDWPGPIALWGSSGQLGRELQLRLGPNLVPLTRADADLTDAHAVAAVLHRLRPSLVINCAAYNFVDQAESEPAAAFAVNALAPRTLARLARELGFFLVHLSTDYVFGLDANRCHPYVENDPPGPLSVYGASKLAGEYFVRSLAPRHLVVRTCGLYGLIGGGKGRNFVQTMLRLARQGQPVSVVADQVLTPSYAADVADAVVALIRSGACGLRHVTNEGWCSWFQFAQAIFELAGLRVELTPITSAQYGAAALRPAYSVLVSQFPDTPRLPPWRDALTRYLRCLDAAG